MSESVESVLQTAMAEYQIPGVVCAISVGGGAPLVFSSGQISNRTGAAPVSRETYFDLASVTKIVTTYQWFLTLVSKGAIGLDDTIGHCLPHVKNWLADVPIWRLANHTSGLAAHQHYYWTLGEPLLQNGAFSNAKENILMQILESKPAYTPGKQLVYSDLGYILLAEILGKCSSPLQTYWSQLYGHSKDTLHWCPSHKTPPKTLKHTYAATEDCPWRTRLIRGEVHDDNCWTLGGVSGHAGTFGRVTDVHKVGQAFLAAYHGITNDLAIEQDLLRESFNDRYRIDGMDRVLGWQLRTPGASSTGQLFSDASFGHLGFTGTSLWIDPEAHIVATILTNRVCPTRDNEAIRAFRPRLHDALRRHINR
jgi:CubicO group peptidase (beta-lactamase class C family)